MSKNLPAHTSAELLEISPEGLELANCYLQMPNIYKVAEALDITPELVTQMLAKREIKAYIDAVFFNLGFNNKFQMRDLLDSIIKKKLSDMDESEVGSSKDITEILALSHKISMEHLNAEIKLEQLRAANHIKTQNNIQINAAPGGSKYSSLIETLMKGDVVDV